MALRAAPVPLGYISNALFYAKPLRYLSAREKQAIYSLFKGGALDVVRTYNPDNYWLLETSRVANSKLHELPLAAKGLRSYRARGRYGWIMIGARDDADALSEARRSTDEPRDLEVWDGSRYVPVNSRAERTKNGAGYYVWVVDSSSVPLAKEGPYGPYHTLEGAKPFARISATEGAHDRIISRGRDPRTDDFEIVRKYQARTGKRLI